VDGHPLPALRSYAGRWVAMVAGRVAGNGPTPSAAWQMAVWSRPRERARVGFVTLQADGHVYISYRLPLPEILEQIRPVLARPGPGAAGNRPYAEVFLVGGAVRDAVQGWTSHDLDFATAGDAVQIARSVADQLGGAFYLLDGQRGTARVVLTADAGSASGRITLDFARFRGNTLGEDLANRDLTLNAMALPVATDQPMCIIDPLGSQRDIANRIMRAAGPTAMMDDPVRCLRAVRQAFQFGYQIEPETRQAIREAAGALAGISAERIRDEFCRLIVGPLPAGALRLLDEFDLLGVLLPEVEQLRHVVQSPPHTSDAFRHTLQVVEVLDQLVDALTGAGSPARDGWPGEGMAQCQARLARLAEPISRHLARPTAGDRTGRATLFMSAVLHDVGKSFTGSTGEDGRIRFSGHEQAGADLAAARARALALSSQEVRDLTTIVGHHMRPAWLANTTSGGAISRRCIYRFFRDVGTVGLDICLLSLADSLSKGSPPDLTDWSNRLNVVETLLEHYYLRPQETVQPPRLLGGRDLMAHLALAPGPEVGQLLEIIREAQAAGEVETAQDALDLAQRARLQQSAP